MRQAQPAPRRILDLPCGYGRVLRFTRAAWPHADIVACELNHDALRFCAETFGVKTVTSREPVWEAEIGDDYDLIWSGSLLTHFDRDHWRPTLAHLTGALAPGGRLLFSTIGRSGFDFLRDPESSPDLSRRLPPSYALSPGSAKQLVHDVQRHGFGFSHYPDQPNSPYGLTVSLPHWVGSELAAAGITLIQFEEAGWGSQDLWTVTK